MSWLFGKKGPGRSREIDGSTGIYGLFRVCVDIDFYGTYTRSGRFGRFWDGECQRDTLEKARYRSRLDEEQKVPLDGGR